MTRSLLVGLLGEDLPQTLRGALAGAEPIVGEQLRPGASGAVAMCLIS